MMRSLLGMFGLIMVLPIEAADPDTTAREALARLLPQSKVESVRPAPIEGMLEVVANGEVLYLSRDGKHLFHGNLLEIDGGRNLTESSRERVRKLRIDALDDDSLIRYEASPASHRITVFTALDCGYCRRFHQGIAEVLARGISVDYVLIPLAGDGSAADATSRSVFCAADRRGALDQAMRGETIEGPVCPSGYEAGKALAAALGINRTPTLIAPDGQQLRFGSAEDLRSQLDAAVASR
jgi:thiol:disulfide interchange protein DsbC